jgi:hypothetical protein
MWGDGCTAAQIGRALSIHPGLVYADLKATKAPRWGRHYQGTAVDPAPVDWENPPLHATAPDPVDRVGLALQACLAELGRARWESAHASEVMDARLRGDEAWEAKTLQLLCEMRRITDIMIEQHESTDPGTLRGGQATWARVPAGVPAVPGEFDHAEDQGPLGLRAELQARVDAGLPLHRVALGTKYGVSDQMIRGLHQRALERKEMIAAGWRPPGRL